MSQSGGQLCYTVPIVKIEGGIYAGAKQPSEKGVRIDGIKHSASDEYGGSCSFCLAAGKRRKPWRRRGLSGTRTEGETGRLSGHIGFCAIDELKKEGKFLP